MARTTQAISETHAKLVADGPFSLSAGQLQKAQEAGLGPLPNCRDPLGHWRAIGAIAEGRERLPEYDETTLALAIAGYPCARLAQAIVRLGPQEPPASPIPDRWNDPAGLLAGQLVEEATPDTLLNRVVRVLQTAAERLGDPWPGSSTPARKSAHSFGLMAALLSETLNLHWSGNPSAVENLDLDSLGSNWLAACLLIPGALGMYGSLVERAEPSALAHAVWSAEQLAKAGEAISPLKRTIRQHWEFVASLTPLVLLWRIVESCLPPPDAPPAAVGP